MGKYFNKFFNRVMAKLLRGCDHRFDMDTIRDCNFEPKCNKCGKYVSGIVGHKKYNTHKYHFELVSEDQYKIKIK